MAKELTWREAIDKVLGESPTPLHYQDITRRIIELSLRKNLGATPAATVNAQIAASIKREGANSPYVRVSRGTFTLRSKLGDGLPPIENSGLAEDDKEEQYAIITSFGMYWRRDLVDWTATPRLLGVQEIGATPVDFSQQNGVYLLYDGREAIYVGRATDRPLGRRLYEHNFDRMSARWDRFSWFGLLPVSNKGQLETLPATYESSKLIPTLEAVLIEALEPRQNRKRGDDLGAVEYMQHIDPQVEKKLLKSRLDAALSRM